MQGPVSRGVGEGGGLHFKVELHKVDAVRPRGGAGHRTAVPADEAQWLEDRRVALRLSAEFDGVAGDKSGKDRVNDNAEGPAEDSDLVGRSQVVSGRL